MPDLQPFLLLLLLLELPVLCLIVNCNIEKWFLWPKHHPIARQITRTAGIKYLMVAWYPHLTLPHSFVLRQKLKSSVRFTRQNSNLARRFGSRARKHAFDILLTSKNVIKTFSRPEATRWKKGSVSIVITFCFSSLQNWLCWRKITAFTNNYDRWLP